MGFKNKREGVHYTGSAEKHIEALGFYRDDIYHVFAYVKGNNLHIEEMQSLVTTRSYRDFATGQLPCKTYPLGKLSDIKWGNFCKGWLEE